MSRISPNLDFHSIWSLPKNPSPERLYCVNPAFHVKQALHRAHNHHIRRTHNRKSDCEDLDWLKLKPGSVKKKYRKNCNCCPVSPFDCHVTFTIWFGPNFAKLSYLISIEIVWLFNRIHIYLTIYKHRRCSSSHNSLRGIPSPVDSGLRSNSVQTFPNNIHLGIHATV